MPEWGMPDTPPPRTKDERAALRALHRAPEAEVPAPRLAPATPTPEVAARAAYRPGADVSGFLREFGLGTAEGVALLCLAEALLRIPDAATADRLIEDRIARADWEAHLGRADSLMMNASVFAFMLTRRVLGGDTADRGGVPAAIARVVRRLGEPVIRMALRRGMRILARQLVLGRTIAEALERASGAEGKSWRRSARSPDARGPRVASLVC